MMKALVIMDRRVYYKDDGVSGEFYKLVACDSP